LSEDFGFDSPDERGHRLLESNLNSIHNQSASASMSPDVRKNSSTITLTSIQRESQTHIDFGKMNKYLNLEKKV
jgi:hypothetical protein